MNKTVDDLIYLCGCAVNGMKPDGERVRAMELEQLYKTAKFHTLTAITAFALESAGVKDRMFSQAKEKAIRKNMALDSERQKLCAYLEENGIWYMPLKGSILKDLYPKYGMRQMADNDILFDEQYSGNVRAYFESNGYEVVRYGKNNHDIYTKPPVLNFEMHTSLFGRRHDKRWQEYYRNIKAKLVRDDGGSYGYHFSDEDFYIYITVHEYKHYSNGGTGLRSLLDRYVYLRRKGGMLDFGYIEAECEKLGITDFEKQSRALAEAVFGVPAAMALSEADRQMLARYSGSGTYGTLENALRLKRKQFAEKTGKTSKFSYAVNRLFPDREWYETFKPFYNRHPHLKPFYVVFRLFNGALFGRKRILSELKILRKS